MTQNRRNAFLPGIIKLPSSRVTMETRLRHWEELAGQASGGWEYHSLSTSEKEPERFAYNRLEGSLGPSGGHTPGTPQCLQAMVILKNW